MASALHVGSAMAKHWWGLILGVASAIGCSKAATSTSERGVTAVDGVLLQSDDGLMFGGSIYGDLPDAGVPDAGPTEDAGIPDGGDAGVPDGGLPDGGLPDGGLPDGGLPDGGLPDGGLPDGGLPDGGLPDGGLPDGGLPDDPGESDGIDPIVEDVEMGAPDPAYDYCDDLAARDALHISQPNDNPRGRSYECYARYVSRIGEPELAPQDPSYSATDVFDGVVPYPIREDFDTAAYETHLFADPPPPAPNTVLKLLEGVDLQGIADDKYSCEPAKAGHDPNPRSGDLWQYMYIPGIQAYDDFVPLNNTGTANRYNQAAEWGADSRNNTNTYNFPVSEISRWRLFHYHNEPDATAGKNGGPVTKIFRKRQWIGPPGNVVGSVENYSLKTHRLTIEADKKEVRLLAAWVSAKTQADFVANPPKPGAGTTLPAGPIGANGPQITAADFTNWYNARIAEKAKGEFQWFVQQAAFVAAHSYYCRKPIFAHSGGGPVKLALLRLLDAYSESLPGKPLQKIRNRNNTVWRVFGLEEVISEQARDLVEALPSYATKLVIYNYVENTGNQKGSNTWRDTIKVEIERVAQKPLVKEYQDMHINVAPGTTGHGWIGWNPLTTGAFYNPKTLFPLY